MRRGITHPSEAGFWLGLAVLGSIAAATDRLDLRVDAPVAAPDISNGGCKPQQVDGGYTKLC